MTTVTYKVLVNGRPGTTITLTRELHQGDPFFPYLFILCAEGLSSMLNGVEKQRKLRGTKIIKGGTSINHLLFTENCILNSRATRFDWKKIQNILSINERGSGQTLNKHKSFIFFSKETPERAKNQVIQASEGFICGNTTSIWDYYPLWVGSNTILFGA